MEGLRASCGSLMSLPFYSVVDLGLDSLLIRGGACPEQVVVGISLS